MDNKTSLFGFKLLVDRAMGILENYASKERNEAIDYALTIIKTRFPDSYEYIINKKYDKSFTKNGNELYESLWNNNKTAITKADFNQNFEKIICEEEFNILDDDNTIQGEFSNNQNILNECDTTIIITRNNNDNCNNLVNTSSSSLLKSSDGILSEKFLITKPLYLKYNEKKFKFFSNKFCIRLLHSEEELICKALRQQTLAVLKLTNNHRKPFLRNFFNTLILTGLIKSKSKKYNKITELKMENDRNGIVKKYDNYIKPSFIEEINENPDINKISHEPENSIDTPKVYNEQKIIEKIVKEKQVHNCLLCPKTYRKRKSLIDHFILHPGYCHDCGKPNGDNLKDIIEHNRLNHLKEFPFICEVCGESYSRRQQFQAHVIAHKKRDAKSYSCVECKKDFPRKKLYRQHLDESGHKPDGAICKVCGAKFSSKNGVYQHMNRVHKKDNSFECHICQNKFSLKANLERHVQLHTEIIRTYICDECGSSYFTYSALKEHSSIAHTNASESKCTLCGKTFSSVKSLQRHLPSHSEERPHCCNYCSQAFKWKTHLVRHKQLVHGNQPLPKKLKRFAKCDEGFVPVEITPPPAKTAKKNNSKSKSIVAINKSSNLSNQTIEKTFTSESQQNFQYSTDNVLNQCNQNNSTIEKNNYLNINNYKSTDVENFNFTTTYKNPELMKSDQVINYDTTYQADIQQHHVQNSQHQTSQIHHQTTQALQTSQDITQQQQLQHTQPTQQIHQQQNQQIHHQQPPHRQQPQHHQQQPSQSHNSQDQHQQTPHHQQTSHMQQNQQIHHQQQPTSQDITQQQQLQHTQTTQQIHQQQNQQIHHQQPQHHQQQPSQSHNSQDQPHQQTPHLQLHHQQPQHHEQQSSQLHNSQDQHHHQQTPYLQQNQQQYPLVSISNCDWPNMSLIQPDNNLDHTVENKDNNYVTVIQVNPNEFIRVPISGINKPENTMESNLLNFQNMWPPNNQQLSYNNTNIEENTYNNIGSILTNLELIGNNPSLDFNNFDTLNNQNTISNQQNQYIQQNIDPNGGNINHCAMNYDYNTQNHTITDISNTILREQDPKNSYQYQQTSGYDPSSIVSYNPTENEKVILLSLSNYMQPPIQQQYPDANIVYYPVKNDM